MYSDQKVNYEAFVRGFFGKQLEVWAAYVPLTRCYWAHYPELLSAGFYLSTQEPLPRSFKASLNYIVDTTLRFIYHVRPADFSNIPRCSVLLFRSTVKPSTDAVDQLAQDLAKSGIDCATMLSRKTLTILHGGSAPEEIPDYAQWMSQGLSRAQAVKTVLRSLWLLLLLTLLALFKSRAVLKRIYSNPFRMWTTLLMTTHRLQVLEQVLAHMKPRLVLVNNERVPVGAELMQAKTTFPLERILFCNELPSIMLDPVVADTVWVWNEVMAKQIEAALRHSRIPAFQIVGHSETEIALQDHPDGEIEISALQKAINTKPTLLFLSEYVPSEVFDLSAATHIAFDWISAAAQHHPDWHFIIKTRPLQAKLKIPGIEIFDELPNVSISETLDLKTMLRLEDICAVAALGSTGLMTGAGVGKTALRFWTEPYYGELGVIDAISVPIHSANDLVQFLADFTHYHPDASLFAYRGQTVQRMKQLCQQHLDNKDI